MMPSRLKVPKKKVPNKKLSFYKKNRRYFMADVVNPNDMYEFYGKGTRVVRWIQIHNGYRYSNILPFPPLKDGEPICELEKKAHERIRKDKEHYNELLAARLNFTGLGFEKFKFHEESKIRKANEAERRAKKAQAEREGIVFEEDEEEEDY